MSCCWASRVSCGTSSSIYIILYLVNVTRVWLTLGTYVKGLRRYGLLPARQFQYHLMLCIPSVIPLWYSCVGLFYVIGYGTYITVWTVMWASVRPPLVDWYVSLLYFMSCSSLVPRVWEGEVLPLRAWVHGRYAQDLTMIIHMSNKQCNKLLYDTLIAKILNSKDRVYISYADNSNDL